jgi:hypothetical protein
LSNEHQPAGHDGRGPAADDTDPRETVGDLAARVGAWETPDGLVHFGSWQAVAAFHHHVLVGVVDQMRQTAPARIALLDAAGIAANVCQEVAELPDRSSPDDWPEAMLVTHEELRAIVVAALGKAMEAGRG